MESIPQKNYVYLCQQFGYDGKEYSKIGVSKHPLKRLVTINRQYGGGMRMHSIWLAPDRDVAFHVERIVKGIFSLKRSKGHEHFRAECSEVKKFVRYIAGHNGIQSIKISEYDGA